MYPFYKNSQMYFGMKIAPSALSLTVIWENRFGWYFKKFDFRRPFISRYCPA
jgi:hypothetical protein